MAAFTAKPNYVFRAYVLYLAYYFLPLVIIVIVESKKHHLSSVVEHSLRDPMTYVEVVAEVTLANVVVSDIIYVCLHSTKH